MLKRLIAVPVVALCVGTGMTTAQTSTAAQTPQSPQAVNDTYIWHGELVSFDAGTRALTVKAHVLPDVAKDVGRFNAGDRVLVTWSGLDKNAGAVRQVMKYDANQKIDNPFSFPMELASRDVQNDCVTFRFRAPEAASVSVNAVKPGEWLTITLRQRPASDAQAVVSIEPFVKSADRSTS